MIIDLARTFSECQNAEADSVDEDWSRYLSHRRGSQTWADLHQNPLVVVLGEAGIGKTVEFQREVERLREAGHAGFFIPLNQVDSMESWQLILTEHETEFEAWAASDEVGYFFLDAVDEARLKSQADFEKALSVILRVLGSNLTRVRVAISSRITDWSAPGVRSVVDTRLTKPIERALAALVLPEVLPNTPVSSTVEVTALKATSILKVFVVTIDPLSSSEARRCAAAFGLQDEQQFWIAVTNGDYEFMATRPLDLGWMVTIWNQRRTLGTYRELIETNIFNRLRELNVNYEAAGEILSTVELHEGASKLAAAAEFGGCAFFTLDVGIVPMLGELSPYSVLPDWQPTAVRRLLATAIFDGASFGRIKFHHRAIREFLAADWVARQLALGVPLQRLQVLFASRVFGHHVLIPARRASLSWLAAISVTAREWVVRHFPEILLFDGDPQAWDVTSAEEAFANFVERSKTSFQITWYKSASEFRRLGSVLSSGKVALALADYSLPPNVRSICFQIARHANLTDCARIAFIKFRDSDAPEWERTMALNALQFIGTPDQRQAVLGDIQAGLLGTNALVAHALPVTEWMHLTAAELSAIFDATQSDRTLGSGTMGDLFERELLPAADAGAALLVLHAVLMSIPAPIKGKRFARFPENDQPERAWLLSVLPDCFARMLELIQLPRYSYPPICIEAAERIEALRDSGFINKDELNRLAQVIVQHPHLRWNIGLVIAQSEDIKASVSRLIWDGRCLVNFGVADLAELTIRANDQARNDEERDIWFEVAMNVAFSQSRGHARAVALRILCLGDSRTSRALRAEEQYDRLRRGAQQQREWNAGERGRKAMDDVELENYRVRIFAHLESIRNGTNVNLLISLLNYSFSRSGRLEYSEVDFKGLAASLNPEIASAFEEGLVACWPTLTPPDPSVQAQGHVPWIGLIGLAGLRISLLNDNPITTLSAKDVANAAQLAVWELHTPPLWFETLARSRQVDVEAALVPWLVAEAQAASPGNGVRGALEMVLRCSQDVRRGLLLHLVPLVVARQINRRETLEAVVKAMQEDGHLSPADVGTLCLAKLQSSIGSNLGVGEFEWMRIWLGAEPSAAWLWFQGHMQKFSGDFVAEINGFAAVALDLKWLQTPMNSDTACLLLGMHALLSAHPSSREPAGVEFFGPSSWQLRDSISNVFLGTRGQLGHDSLVAMLATLTSPAERGRANAQLAQHAELDAAQGANRTPVALNSISLPFLSEPTTEAELYEQVVARLEEIRKNLEEGPFSERDLFWPGMPEKFLQRWLAAKFRETQNRRFSVHREEEVDDNNMTDIQLSCRAGNVCVEIKPVDVTRGYSANSLTDTLQTQIVGQYLRGSNSTRGILVLMQLDRKTWNIPGRSRGEPFASLVDHLEEQAQAIKRNSVGLDELVVFGIQCVV